MAPVAYTYADYSTWHFGGVVELLNGRMQSKSPAPHSPHQVCSWRLTLKIGQAIAEKLVLTDVLVAGRYESAGEHCLPVLIPCHTLPGL